MANTRSIALNVASATFDRIVDDDGLSGDFDNVHRGAGEMLDDFNKEEYLKLYKARLCQLINTIGVEDVFAD